MSDQYFIVSTRPQKFEPAFIAAGCCLVFEDKILFLRRNPQKPYGNTWGVPGGKLEKNESLRQCVVREIYEEAGLTIDDDGLEQIGTLYCSIPNGMSPLKYEFHLFQKKFTYLPLLNLGLDEHVEAKWATCEDILALPLIIGGREVFEFYQSYNQSRCK